MQRLKSHAQSIVTILRHYWDKILSSTHLTRNRIASSRSHGVKGPPPGPGPGGGGGPPPPG
eukprot:759417-Karenia_brevis.AAC.1